MFFFSSCSTSNLKYGPHPAGYAAAGYQCTTAENYDLSLRATNFWGLPGNGTTPANFTLTLQHGTDPLVYPEYQRLSYMPCTFSNVGPDYPLPAYTNGGVDGYFVTLDTSKMPSDKPYTLHVQWTGRFDVTYHFILSGDLVHAE